MVSRPEMVSTVPDYGLEAFMTRKGEIVVVGMATLDIG